MEEVVRVMHFPVHTQCSDCLVLIKVLQNRFEGFVFRGNFKEFVDIDVCDPSVIAAVPVIALLVECQLHIAISRFSGLVVPAYYVLGNAKVEIVGRHRGITAIVHDVEAPDTQVPVMVADEF